MTYAPIKCKSRCLVSTKTPRSRHATPYPLYTRVQRRMPNLNHEEPPPVNQSTKRST
jgi:hypothetical protein